MKPLFHRRGLRVTHSNRQPRSGKSSLGNLSRRDFIKSVAVATLAANLIGCGKRVRKPNLLFIMTDEQAANTMKAYGNSKIATPNLNRVAEESVVFKNAYVSQPVCTPARSTIMTGLWPTQNTMVRNGLILPRETKCIPEIMSDDDYVSGYFGKWHLGDEQFVQHGFDEWVSTEEYSDYSSGREERKVSDYWHFLKREGYTPDPISNLFSREFAASLPIEHCKPKYLEQNAIAFLKQHRNDPFVLYVSFLEPHMPFFGPLNDMYNPDEMELPPNFDDPLEDEEPAVYRNTRNKYLKEGGYGFPLRTEQHWRRLIANYWGLVSQVDRSVGAILKTLESLSLDDHTIVVFTSDHGDMMGSHRLIAKDVMYEESVKVPWIIRIPGRKKEQQFIENPVSQIDLVPTLLDLMGTKADREFPGRSMVPLIESRNVEEDHVFVQWNGFNRSYGQYETESKKAIAKPLSVHDVYFRAVISPDRWKLNLSDTDRNQLFDLNRDPHEEKNLYYSGLYQDVIDRLTKKIHGWQSKVGDKVKVNHTVFCD
jgi:arylsulfatase A-like enzyme